VLHSAMLVFWRKGYHATSVKDLIQATELQPGSLYGTFKNKRTLFLDSLDAYFDSIRTMIAEILHSPAAPLLRIQRFFDRLMKDSRRDPDVKGCMLVNTLLEIPADDEEIIRRVARMFREVEREFRGVLEEAAANGDLSPDKDPKALARLLLTGIYGLRVYNKTRPDAGAMKSIVDQLLSVLRT
jgi:TetR/AcrR family transcriptional repressor of nem operon